VRAKAVLFDLDGTLIDSLPDLAGTLNALLAEEGLAALSFPEVAAMIGNGVAKLTERGFRARGVELSPAALVKKTAEFVALYEPRATRDTRLFPSVVEVLQRFAEKKIPVAVVTNKVEAATHRILDAFGLSALVTVVVGGDHGPPLKPAPGMLLAACDLLGVAPRDVVMVGDSINDIASAKAAGIRSIAVSYGYTAIPQTEFGADALVDGLDAVADLILEEISDAA
jgi:phosphoglycolate phosphatase